MQTTFPEIATESKDPLVDCAKACVLVLSAIDGPCWADIFVDLRMWFHRKHGRNLVVSTSHGVDFFQNIIDVAEGRLKWKEEGEYGDNFRKLVADRPRTRLTE